MNLERARGGFLLKTGTVQQFRDIKYLLGRKARQLRNRDRNLSGVRQSQNRTESSENENHGSLKTVIGTFWELGNSQDNQESCNYCHGQRFNDSLGYW